MLFCHCTKWDLIIPGRGPYGAQRYYDAMYNLNLEF